MPVRTTPVQAKGIFGIEIVIYYKGCIKFGPKKYKKIFDIMLILIIIILIPAIEEEKCCSIAEKKVVFISVLRF